MANDSTSRRSSFGTILGAVALVAGAFFTSWWLSSNQGPAAPNKPSESGSQDSTAATTGPNTDASLSKPMVVKSAQSVENYTYLELMRDIDDTVWVAVPKFEVHVGERVVYADPLEMSDFHSRTLDRTFPTIYFARAAFVLGEDGKIARTTGLDETSHPQRAAVGNPHGTAGDPHGGQLPTKIKAPKLAKPPGGQSIAEVYAKAKQLNGKPVKVRGTVVKATLDVLGANWYHLRDGSADDKTGDLTITSKEKLQRGDVVVASGALVTKKDLGANYVFDALIENATIEQESAPASNGNRGAAKPSPAAGAVGPPKQSVPAAKTQ